MIRWRSSPGRRTDTRPARRDVHLLAIPEVDTLAFWFHSACVLADGFHPALMNVVYRGMPPAQALEQGEADFEALLKTHKASESDEA